MVPTKTASSAAKTGSPRKSKRKVLVGEVVSTKMEKTIVIEVTRKFSHPLYTRVMSRDKRFYAHDESKEAHLGDIVRIEETRPLSKLKRWRLLEIVRRSSLTPEIAAVKIP
jgi:small subunit ribosomal protein S17